MKKTLIPFIFILSLIAVNLQAQVSFSTYEKGDATIFVLQNQMVRQSVVIRDNQLISDTLQSLEQWVKRFNRPVNFLVTDAGFELEIVWNRWYDRTPGTQNNADNPAYLTKKNFAFDHYRISENENSEKVLDLYFKGTGNTIELRLSYKLAPGEFYSRRKIVLEDPKLYGHYLEKVNTRQGLMAFEETGATEADMLNISMEGLGYSEAYRVENKIISGGTELLKTGEFGQPFALRNKTGGAFDGIEYPTGVNGARQFAGGKVKIDWLPVYRGKTRGKTG